MADTQSQFITYKPSYPERLLIWEKALPMPPSVNQLYAFGQSGPYLKREIVIFREQVQLLVGSLIPGPKGAKPRFKHTPFADRLAMDIYVTAKDHARRDMDNLEKCLLDALTKSGVYQDDFQLDDVRIRRAASQKDNPHVIVRLYRLSDVKLADWETMKQEGFYLTNGEPYANKPKAPARSVTSSRKKAAATPPQ